MHHALSGFALSLLGMAYLPMMHVLQLLSWAFCNVSYKDYRKDHRLQDPVIRTNNWRRGSKLLVLTGAAARAS